MEGRSFESSHAATKDDPSEDPTYLLLLPDDDVDAVDPACRLQREAAHPSMHPSKHQFKSREINSDLPILRDGCSFWIRTPGFFPYQIFFQKISHSLLPHRLRKLRNNVNAFLFRDLIPRTPMASLDALDAIGQTPVATVSGPPKD